MALSEERPAKRQRLERETINTGKLIKENKLPATKIGSLYLNERSADVYFVCGEEKKRIPAHKCILSKASSVFDDMFYGEAAVKGDVKLASTSPEAFKDFLMLFYLKQVNIRTIHLPEIIGLMKKFGLNRVLYDLNIPAANDSPSHILNALNDDCIQAIFQKITHSRDYLNVAETCLWFQQSAKTAFPSKLEMLRICNVHDPITLDLTRAKKFLKHFGPSVKSIDFKPEHGNENDTLNLISDLCGKTLIELKISNTSETLDFNTRSPFDALEKLTMADCTISNFNLHSQLKCLDLQRINCNPTEIIQHFPKLEEANVTLDINHDYSIDFVRLNPQLQSFKITATHLVHLPNLEIIVSLVPNLVSFTFEGCVFNQRNYENLLNLSRFHNLKRLHFLTYYCKEVTILNRCLDSLAENNVQLEELLICRYPIDEVTSITKFQFLKKLCIDILLEENKLIHLVKNLPNLEEIRVRYSSGTKLTENTLSEIVALGNSLKKLTFSVDMLIEKNDFEWILALIKGRVNVQIKCKECKVSKGRLDANRKWLKIVYGYCARLNCF